MRKLLDLTAELHDEKLSMNFCPDKISKNDMAIIGVAINLPQANDINSFWEKLKKKEDFIGNIPANRREDILKYLKFKNINRDNIKFPEAAYLEHIDLFDYEFFGISPKEASLICPQQRMFLETAWEAIEDSGYGGNKLIDSKTGVFVGINTSLINQYQTYISEVEPSSTAISLPGNVPSFIAGRIGYIMDFKGPSMIIDTACSSSLVAVHLACQSIRRGECDLALVGGVSINLMRLEISEKVGFESSDGRTKAFDDKADGIGSGEGVGAILIKPYYQAVNDNDSIYSAIKGSAINQDGHSIGITAPNPAAQAEVIKECWRDAGIHPETISYIEAHGTGTRLGDPIEIEGITSAFRQYTNKNQFCALGSVKTNIGHLDGAAGIISLVKAVLMFANKEIPATLHFKLPNREINFIKSPVYVNYKLKKWETGNSPRRCGISAFGISGTNCHLVLEEATVQRNVVTNQKEILQVFTLSANSRASLKGLIERYKLFLEKENDLELRNVCYTANSGRGHYRYRLALIIRDFEDFKAKINCLDQKGPENIDDAHVYVSKNFFSVGDKTQTRTIGASEAELVEYWIEREKNDKETLRNLCELYIQGADINWERFYEGENRRRVHLPGYHFDKKRCWLEVPFDEQESPAKKGMFYTMGWKKAEIEQLDNTTMNRSILFVSDNHSLCKKIEDELRIQFSEVIRVEFGRGFVKEHRNEYILDGSMDSFTNLFHDIKDRNITNILYMPTISDDDMESMDTFNAEFQRGVDGLFNMTKAIYFNKFRQEIGILLVGKNLNEVTGREKTINPQNAAMFGLGKVVTQEFPNLSCRCLDIDETSSPSQIIQELKSQRIEYVVSLRNNERYVEEFKQVELDRVLTNDIKLKSGGTYLITGGTGGIGLKIGKFLASTENINLALLNRSAMPERDKWDEIIKEGKQSGIISKIAAIREIEDTGSRVILYYADVTDMERMKLIHNELVGRYGKINGIIHAAGFGGYGFIANEEIEQFREVLLPKVEGTWILDYLSRESKPDFFVMCSSFTSVTGAPGHGDYTAANAFLESFSAYRKKKGRPSLTINWTRWKDTGMSLKYHLKGDEGIFKELEASKAVEAFSQLLNKDIGRVIVGELNYENKESFRNFIGSLGTLGFQLSKGLLTEIEKLGNAPEDIKGNVKQHIEQTIKSEHKTFDCDYVEKKVMEIWKEILGYEDIDTNDLFFNIGGNSIMIIKMHKRIEEEFPGKVAIADLFTYTTISKLAKYIYSGEEQILDNLSGLDDKEDMDSYIENILQNIEEGNLTIAEATERLI